MKAFIVVATSLLAILSCLVQETASQGCDSARNCSECLDMGASCRWCGDRLLDWTKRPRCQATDSALSGCSNVSNPQGSIAITMNEPFGEDTQVMPQEYTIALRPGQVETLTVRLKPRANYPLDVYYLMDHSKSMEDDLRTLKDNALDMAAAINDISANYRIGFGSFIDKIVPPFGLTLDNVAIKQADPLKVGYGFHNTFPLQYRAREEFGRRVDSQIISGNIDSPEGALDGMMQVAVCDQIGWREKSRKVMIVGTDERFHSAGDGRLAGIISSNDGLCHLDGEGFYTESLKQDYPSVGWLNNRLVNHSILPIFTVTKRVLPMYQALSERISDSRVVELTTDSSNLVSIVKSELAKLIKEGKITVFPEGGVDVDIQAACPKNLVKTDPVTGYPTCTGLEQDTEARYTITLTALKCAELRNLDTVTIRFVGFGDVVINIKPLCSCLCEDHPIRTREWCGEHGEDQCAICVCDPDFTGARCNCTKNKDSCIEPSSNVTCTNRGKCECGKCECKPVFPSQKVWGDYCECDNTSCPKDLSGRLCGGSSQGLCHCTCQCKEGFFGSACNCTNTTSTCTFPGENRLCSGNGRCECGKCECNPGFDGLYCQECIDSDDDPETEEEQCKDICVRSHHCLSCSIGDTEGECSDCQGYTSIQSPGASHFIRVRDVLINAKRCEAVDGEGCQIVYWVVEDPQEEKFAPLEIESETKRCPKPVNYLPLILGIVFGLLLLGLLLLLLWRICIGLKDRNEYNRFMKSRGGERAQGDNPLFKAPIQTFPNPGFGK